MKIDVNVTEGKGVRRVLDIRVEANEVDSEYKKATREVKNGANIPGFRPGKAPDSIIESRFKEDISRSVLENILPTAFSEALKQTEIKPVGEPEIKDVKFKRGEPLTFRALVDISPKVTPTEYTKLKLYRRPYEVTDEDVDKGIRQLKERLAVVREVTDRPARQGDIVMAEITKLPGGDHIGDEQYVGASDIQLDTKYSLPEFVDSLIGKNIGEAAEVTVKYPPDYFEKELANYTFIYRVEIVHIREKDLPELDESVIEQLNIRDDDGELVRPENVPDKVRGDLEESFELNNRRDMENQAVNLITGRNQFDIPESIMNRYLDSMVEDYKQRNRDLDEEKARDSLKPTADKYVRWYYLRDAIAEKEGIAVGDEDIDRYRERLVKTSGIKPEDAERYMRAGNRLENIKDQILEEKIMDFILKNAEIEDRAEPEQEEEGKKDSIIITPEGK
jgi:trigger factor